jgi:hypothetical protein
MSAVEKALLLSVLNTLKGLKETPPPVFFELLHRALVTGNAVMATHVCEAWGLPYFPHASQVHTEKEEEEEEEVEPCTDEESEWKLSDDDELPMDDETSLSCAQASEVMKTGGPVQVGNVYQVEAEEEADQTTDTSFFMVTEVDPLGLAHKIRWLYTVPQVPFTIPEHFTSDINQCICRGMWAVFISDHYQRLSNPETWINVTPRLVDNPYVDGLPINGVCIIGIMNGERIVRTDMAAYLKNQLLGNMGTHTKGLAQKFWKAQSIRAEHIPIPHEPMRCEACNRRQPIAMRIHFTIGRSAYTSLVGRSCGRKIMAAHSLNGVRVSAAQFTEAMDALAP